MNSEIVFDCETDGLNPSTIWCLVAQVVGEEKQHTFINGPSFLAFLENYEGATLYAHNGLAFDYPVLTRLWGISLDRWKRRDTLVLSRLANPSRDGGHSLRSWGDKLGFPKGDHSDWSCYSPEMLTYCKQDVAVTVKALGVIKGELEGFSDESQDLEHSTAEIITEQVRKGWLLDTRKCYDLLGELKERQMQLEDEVRDVFVPRCKFVKKVTPRVKKDGGYSTVGLKFLGDDCLRVVGGEFSRVEYPEFNLGSRKQIGEYLIHFGWKPKTFTPTEQPIVDEAVLSEVTDIPQAQLIADFLLVQKRVAMVQSWLDAEVDGRVHGRVNSNGAVTGRMTHNSPNLAQVPASYSPYGAQCREVWTVPEGYRLVGCDASGLELRMLAHYMNDEDYTKELLNGDIHTFNQQAAGLPTRDLAKTFIYAFLYGAGDAKIGEITGGTKHDGRKLKAKFLRNIPALLSLRERVEEAANRGWLKGLDGRRITVRSPHAALNTLLQGAGAVVMKQALIRLDQMATAHGLNYSFVGNVHDEIQSEVTTKDAAAFGKLAAYSIARAGQDFNLRCPLAGEYKIGTNWSETH